MRLADAPWKHVYPPGLSPDVALDSYAVHEVLDRAAAIWGGKDAVIFRDRTFTYGDLKRDMDRAARAFLAAGIGKGARIALLLPNTVWHFVAFFGALRAGATIVHLSPLDGERVALHKLADSGATALVSTNIGDLAMRATALAEAAEIGTVLIGDDSAFGPSPLTGPKPEASKSRDFGEFLDSVDGRVESGPEALEPLPEVDPDSLALLQYTGGTTGMPKGAMLTHRNLTSAVESYTLWSDATGTLRRGEECVLLVLPLFHIYALVSVMLRCVHGGQTMILHTRFDPGTALAEIENRITVFPGVPTMWIAISQTPGFEKRDFSRLHTCASGGAPLPVEVARKLKSATGHDVLGGWGMTETSPAGTNIPTTRPDKVATIGIPLPGIWLDVVALDDPHRVLPQGETGELRIFGPNVTAGYLNREAETKASFADGGFLTGDIGFMDEEGFFTIVDRKKDMILSGGFNVYPQMIEQAIYEHPDVEEVLVIGIPDGYRGEAAKAFVKLRAGATPLALDSLRDFLKPRLGPHEMPAALEIRDALPRTPVGKLSKLELRQEEARRHPAARAS